MTTVGLLAGLAVRGVRLGVSAGCLAVDAPAGVLTDAHREELAARKEELLAHRLYANEPGLTWDAELASITAEQVALFRQREGYNPREAAELDAWSNSAEEWAEYRAQHPAPMAEAQQEPEPEPEQTAQPAQEPAPAAEQQVPAPEEPKPTHTLAQANATLVAFGQECRTAADTNYRLAGLAWQFTEEFLGAAPGKAQRSTAVERLAAEWLLWDEESLAVPQAQALKRLRERVNLLLRCHAVATLLGDGRGVAKGNGTRKGRGKGKDQDRLPWGKVRELCPLVERLADEHSERWQVLPHVGDKARALVAEIAASGMDRKDVVAAVARLVEEDRAARADVARQQAEKARAEQEARARAEQEAKQAVFQAAQQAEQARKQAAEAPAEEKARLAAAAEQARQELLARQREQEQARLAAEQAARDKARAEQEAQQASPKQAEAEGRAAAKEKARGKGKGQDSPTKPATDAKQAQTPESAQGTNILGQLAASAGKATPKDYAAMLTAAACKHEDMLAVVCELASALVSAAAKGQDGPGPDDVFLALLEGLDGHSELSRQSHRAAKAARLTLERKDSPAPADVANRLSGKSAPSSNGKLVPTAAA